MKTIPFVKLAGAGNDFIVIDHREDLDYVTFAQKVCDRTNGIGADGVLVYAPSKEADFTMRIINADGTEAEMCGNGARCIVRYVHEKHAPQQTSFQFETLAGEIHGKITGSSVCVGLSDPSDFRPDLLIDLDGQERTVHFIDTGVPHAVMFVQDLDAIDVSVLGHKIRYHQQFAPRGTNANFVQVIDPSLGVCSSGATSAWTEKTCSDSLLLAVRTYERGVEDETKACGTGSVAAALIGYRHLHPDVLNQKGAKMKVRTRGGEVLQVTFDLQEGQMNNVWLKGSANWIAEGQYFWDV